MTSVKAVLVVSAHWEEKEFTVNVHTDQPQLLYDYYGFPGEAYKVRGQEVISRKKGGVI